MVAVRKPDDDVSGQWGYTVEGVQTVTGSYYAQPIPGSHELCAEDFDRIAECRLNPPQPSPAALEANRLFYELLDSLA